VERSFAPRLGRADWRNQSAAGTEHVEVYGTLPDSDIGLSNGKVPGLLQSFSADQITAPHRATVLDALALRPPARGGQPARRLEVRRNGAAVRDREQHVRQSRRAIRRLFRPMRHGGLVTPALTDPRTLTLRQPVSFQLGLELKF
jgi:hypothetical protein